MDIDQRVPRSLGRVLDASARPVGTCFQVSPGVLITASHVLDDLAAADVDSVISVDPLQGDVPRQAQVIADRPDASSEARSGTLDVILTIGERQVRLSRAGRDGR